MNIIILGPQGSGKSTQGQMLSKELGLPLLDVGAFLREKSQEETEVGRRVKETIDKGELLDDLSLTELIAQELSSPKYKTGFVMDGAPRTLRQAELLEDIARIDKVFYLSVPDDINIKRLLGRGRKDDTPELIKKRLALYYENTRPALDYYEGKGVLEEVDGAKVAEEVFEEVLSKVKKND